MPKFTFDLTLYTTIQIPADSEEQARIFLRNHVNGGEANLGSLPNGDPIISEIHLYHEDDHPIIEIDGNAV
jgi:hypothetical protein